MSGSLPAGFRLPSKRALSEHLGISVISVENAYRLLIDEGYAYSRERSGFFVGNMVEGAHAGAEIYLGTTSAGNETANVSETALPISVFSKIIRKVSSEYGERLLTKPPHNGLFFLRSAISEYLLRYRGMKVHPDRIVIGSGAEYLYVMIVQLLGRNRVYGTEDPSYKKIRATYEASGAVCRALKMGHEGIESAYLDNTDATILHVTPFHSYPSGVTAAASKRLEYLNWAEKRNGIIIEDDYDSEFAVGMKPVETIFSMDKHSRVIYMNTFSKSLSPSMRIGYMILPEALSALYEEKLGFYSCTVPVFDQYVLAEFISGGYFERHLNKMRRTLKQNAKGRT